MRPTVCDPCLFIKRSRTGRLIMLLLYVDDMQISVHPEDEDEWNQLKAKLLARFDMKDIGDSTWLLGLRIQRDEQRGFIHLTMEQYILNALKRFGMNKCSPAGTPAAAGQDLSGDQSPPLDRREARKYMELVGTLLFAAMCVRVDIAHAVHELTKHAKAPQQHHMLAAKRVLRYLKGTASRGLVYGRPEPADLAGYDVNVTAYADASYADNREDRKSTTGWITMLGGDVIQWASKKQATVALSSCEAELNAETACVQEVIWMRHLLEELGLRVRPQSVIYGDNEGTIKLSNDGHISERTKHVQVHYHFVKEAIGAEWIKIVWLPSAQQRADMLTKPLRQPAFEDHRDALMGARGAQLRDC
jgi:hypothetical protein